MRSFLAVMFGVACVWSSAGCSVFRNENSWYKAPNIVTRDMVADTNKSVPQGVEPPAEWALFSSGASNVTQINPWIYAVPGEKDGEDGFICLYRKIIELAESDDEEDIALAMMYRDMLQDAIIGVSNTVGSAHVGTILGIEDSQNLVLGFADLAFDGAAAIVTPASTKTAFAVLSGIAGGSRSLLNEEIYSNVIAPAIVKAILKERLEIWEQIVQRRKDDVRSYNVEQAIADAIAYHESWSFYLGMQSLAEAGQTRLTTDIETIQEKIRKAQGESESPVDSIRGLQQEIEKLPAATQVLVYGTAGAAISRETFMAGKAAIATEADFDALFKSTSDSAQLLLISNRLEAAYNVHKP